MKCPGRVIAAIVATVIGLPWSAFGQGVAYEVQEGSFIRDECENCDRIPIQEPIEGTLIFTQVPAGFPGDLYEVSGIDLSSPSGNYVLTGKGSYEVLLGDPPTQAMNLETEVNNMGGIQLMGEPAKLFAIRPALSIQVTEPKPYRDPFHIYTLHLLAAPKAQEQAPYELVEESTYQDCLPCARPPILVPLSGGFILGKVEENPLFVTYRMDGIDFWDTKGDWKLKIHGSGSYRWGREVAIVQEMRIEVTVEQAGDVRTGVLLANIEPAPGASFPEIAIQLEHDDPFPWYSVHLVARPRMVEASFRRGDANADGATDISDAVAILGFLFLGSTMNNCEDAADVNDDGNPDISDPVRLLGHLFLGSEAPPDPFTACGVDSTGDDLDCKTFDECP